jgi:hypothetical protein
VAAHTACCSGAASAENLSTVASFLKSRLVGTGAFVCESVRSSFVWAVRVIYMTRHTLGSSRQLLWCAHCRRCERMFPRCESLVPLRWVLGAGASWSRCDIHGWLLRWKRIRSEMPTSTRSPNGSELVRTSPDSEAGLAPTARCAILQMPLSF